MMGTTKTLAPLSRHYYEVFLYLSRRQMIHVARIVQGAIRGKAVVGG